MKNKIYQTFDEAVADVPDGSVFMSPGFGGVGLSRNLLAALQSSGCQKPDRHLQQRRHSGC